MDERRIIITQLLLSIIYLISCVKSQDCEPTNGTRQSPININLQKVIVKSTSIINYSKQYLQKSTYQLINIGTTFRLESKCPSNTPTISSKIIHGLYRFQQLHFHWGTENTHGSEHTINNFSYPMEMHVVHEQVENNTNNDQFVVIAYFLEISKYDNPALQKLVDVFFDIINENDTVRIKKFALSELVAIHPLDYYFNYPGSLTVPPYTESLNWLINLTPLKISNKQIEVFRRAAQENPEMINNYRCVQKLNGRKVYFYASRDSYN